MSFANASVLQDLRHFDDGLRQLEMSDGPLLSASFDLRPDSSGSPTVLRELRQAVRLAAPEASQSGLEHLERELTTPIEELARDGHVGVFIAGTTEEPVRLLYVAAIPPRNQLQIGPDVARFELERHRALTRTPVAALWVERAHVLASLVEGDLAPVTEEIEGDDHHMRGTLGRTGQHGRGGSAETPSGGHGKSNVEASAEEAQDRFARMAAERVSPVIARADIILLEGREESTARLSGHLGALEKRLEAGMVRDRTPNVEELIAEARERASRAQYEAAERLAQDIEGGALGDRVAVGIKPIRSAITGGQLESLVLDENAVGHLGSAEDARPHEPARAVGNVEALLAAALAQGATPYFLRRDSDQAATPSPPLGVLRW